MNKKAEYVVTSETTRVEEGRPDLCWMDINVGKLNRCCKVNGVYSFRCDIGGEQYKFYKKAGELKDAFVKKGIYIKENKGSRAYSFYLDYRNGAIYKSKTKGLPSIITLNPVGGEKYQSGALVLSELLGQTRCLELLVELVAKTAIWAPPVCHQSLVGKGYAKYPDVRRKKNGEKKGKVPGENIRLDDNTYPNRQMKAMGKKFYGTNFKDYTTCHIWEDTCYDTRYHTCFANLVLLPSALASLSDFCPEIKAILKYRSYELYGWLPEDGEIKKPRKPKYYPNCWEAIPRGASGIDDES